MSEFAKDYAEHVATGKVCLEFIPDHLKHSFIEIQKEVDRYLNKTLGGMFDDEKRVGIKKFIFRDTESFESLIRKLWLAKLYYPDYWSYLEAGDDLRMFLVDDMIRKYNPLRSGFCPFCKQEVKK